MPAIGSLAHPLPPNEYGSSKTTVLGGVRSAIGQQENIHLPLRLTWKHELAVAPGDVVTRTTAITAEVSPVLLPQI